MLILALICLCIFVTLAVTYNTQLLQRIDEAAAAALFGNDIVMSFHYVGETVVAVGLGILMMIYYVWRKKRLEALLVLSTIFIGYGINQVIKNVIERPRPILEHQLTSYSFPSAHTMASLLWIVTLLYIATYGKKKTNAVIIAWGIGIVVAMLAGLSRVAQGHHFFTDIVAGWLLATAWLLVCIHVFKRKKTAQSS